MSNKELNLDEIKKYILEKGKDYRKNILKYLSWVNEDYEHRHSILENEMRDITTQTSYVVEGLRTQSEWYRVNRDAKNDYLVNHSTSNGFKINVKLGKNELQKFLDGFDDIPKEYIDVKNFEKAKKEDYEEAMTFYHQDDALAKRTSTYVTINDEIYNSRYLSMLAYGIKNNLGPNEMPNQYIISESRYNTNIKRIYNDDNSFKFLKIDNDFKRRGEDMSTIKDKIDLLKHQKQIILQGPPGTGKTRVAKIIAINMLNDNNPITDDASNDDIKKAFDALGEKAKLIQFHPSYSYEDFVRGITAKTEEDTTGINYVVENKVLSQMAKNAKDEWDKVEKKNAAKKYILIIDEINRANLSSVLGELIYALEYRDEAVESMYEHPIYGREITLPSNLYIIGTMNTADRSVGHIDYAIRRRFSFESVLPNKNIVRDKELFEKVEIIFEDNISPEFNKDDVLLGHSYFIGDVESKLKYQVKPLLKEYIKDGILNENSKIDGENILDYIHTLSVTNQDED